MKNKPLYPYCDKLGLTLVYDETASPLPYIEFSSLHKALAEHKIAEQFHEAFGIQTMYELGPYPHDVENALREIYTGKKLNALEWD